MSAIHARCLLCDFFLLCECDPFPSDRVGSAAHGLHFSCVLPITGELQIHSQVSILRDAYYHLRLSEKARWFLKVAGQFWLISPLTALVSFPQEIQAVKDKESPSPNPDCLQRDPEEPEFLQVSWPCSQSSWPEPFNRAHDHLASWLISFRRALGGFLERCHLQVELLQLRSLEVSFVYYGHW